MGIYDVPAGMLIEESAKDFKTRVKKPAFTDYVKTGSHKERAPNNPDWFFTRMAAVLYRTYKEGNLGTGRLRTYFGGRKNRGVRPEKKVKASGKILRVCLQMLEKEGLVKKEKKGRKVTAKGEKFLSEKAKICQVVFDAKRKGKQDKLVQDAERRVANRAKAAAQLEAGAQPAQKGKGPAPQIAAAKPVAAPGATPTPAAPHAQAVQKPVHPEAHKGTDDGRARTEAKKD